MAAGGHHPAERIVDLADAAQRHADDGAGERAVAIGQRADAAVALDGIERGVELAAAEHGIDDGDRRRRGPAGPA